MKTCRMMFYSDYISEKLLLNAARNSSCLDNCYLLMYEKKWNQEKHKRMNLDPVNRVKREVENLKFVFVREEDIGAKSEDTPANIEIKCRNYGLERARRDGNDCILIQDTDEFMMRENYDFLFNKYYDEMVGLGYNMATIRYMNFWKDWNHVVVDEEGNPFQTTKDILEKGRYKLGSWKNFLLKLDSGLYFEDWDVRNSIKSWMLYDEVFLYHGSWILSDEEVLSKIGSWGHSTDATKQEWRDWYDQVWLKWRDESDEISMPMRDKKIPAWKKVVRYQGNLPSECQ